MGSQSRFRSLPVDVDATVTIGLPGLKVTAKVHDVARELVIPDRGVLNARECCDDCIDRARIIRALLGFVEGEAPLLDATGLATQAGVTQPRASQVLGRLHDLNLISKREGCWWPDREPLLDRFRSVYRGSGSESYFYSLAEPSEVVIKATRNTTPPYPSSYQPMSGPTSTRRGCDPASSFSTPAPTIGSMTSDSSKPFGEPTPTSSFDTLRTFLFSHTRRSEPSEKSRFRWSMFPR